MYGSNLDATIQFNWRAVSPLQATHHFHELRTKAFVDVDSLIDAFNHRLKMRALSEIAAEFPKDDFPQYGLSAAKRGRRSLIRGRGR
jgi:hypothetical protein